MRTKSQHCRTFPTSQLSMTFRSKKLTSRARRVKSAIWSENLWSWKEKWTIFLSHLEKKNRKGLMSRKSNKNWSSKVKLKLMLMKILQDFCQDSTSKSKEIIQNLHTSILRFPMKALKTKIAKIISRFNKPFKNEKHKKNKQE